MKNFLIVLIMLMFCNVITFAEIKTFTKEATEVVPENQSQAQVIAYLTQKLTRQATEEAGVFINTEFSVKNKEITKDEFTSVAGSISKVVVENKETFTRDNQQYVKVKVKIDVDTDSIQPYLDKIMQDNQYKREAEELRKEKLELEEKLKTATKKQYEQELSAQVQQQVELQKQRAIELNKMAIQAKEEYAKLKKEQNKKVQEREQEILKLKEQIAQEKDNIKKAELENQTKIKELELKANANQQSWTSNKNKISIQQAIKEATKVKQETDEIINKFETLLKENKETIIKSYDEQMQLSCNTKERDQWEIKEEYNIRLEKNKQISKILEQEKEESILKNERKIIEHMVATLKPFIDRLEYFQSEKFYDENVIKVELVSIDKINIDKQFFIANIKYNKKKYSLKYDFSEIGIETAKLIYQTQNQFIVEPLFSITNKLKEKLVAFNIKHLGTGVETIVKIPATIKVFDEIKKQNLLLLLSKKLKICDLIDKELENFENKKNLKNFTKIKENLKRLKSLLLLDKVRIEEVKAYVDSLQKLIIAAISDFVDNRNKVFVVGLRRDGTAITTNGNNYKNILALGMYRGIYQNYFLLLKKDGDFIVISAYGIPDYEYNWIKSRINKKNIRWVTDVSTSFGVTINNDGSVFYHLMTSDLVIHKKRLDWSIENPNFK